MLRYISNYCFINTKKINEISCPVALDTTCPYCKRKVTFTLNWPANVSEPTASTKAHCPGCQKNVLFILLIERNPATRNYSRNLFVFPDYDSRKPLPGLDESENLKEGIKKDYYSTINVLNAREWNATAVLCRRVLEGITQEILDGKELNKPLAEQLSELSKHVDLSKPIITLAHALRKGGNLGAHFNLEREATDEISNLMVELLDYLIEYIFILPNKIESLHDKIEKLSNKPNNGS